MRLGIVMAVISLFFAASTISWSSAGSACPFSGVTSGQKVSIQGKIGQAPHDMVLVVPGCDTAVVLVYADDIEGHESKNNPVQNENLKRFEKYTRASYNRIGGKGICTQCPKYDVEATLHGRIDIAPETIPDGLWKDGSGWLHDKTGAFVGKVGFGHPPIYQYQLVIDSVSDLGARKLPKP